MSSGTKLSIRESSTLQYNIFRGFGSQKFEYLGPKITILWLFMELFGDLFPIIRNSFLKSQFGRQFGTSQKNQFLTEKSHSGNTLRDFRKHDTISGSQKLRVKKKHDY